jgi:RNA polymerase sigma factor for flagellar operon FliA
MNHPDRFPRPARRCVNTPLTPEQAARADAHTGLVRGVARRVLRIVSAHLLSFEELVSVGNEALVRAATRYEPHSRASFATFVRYRVYGAMLDAIRKQTFGQRRYKHAGSRLRATEQLLSGAAEDQPTSERRILEQRVQMARDQVSRASSIRQLSRLDTHTSFEGVAADQPSPEQILERMEVRHRLRALVANLEPQERALIDALYVHDRQMTEVAEEIGTSCATISRRHAQVIARLRKRLLAQDRGRVGPGMCASGADR